MIDKKKILMIHLEFSAWQQAKSWSYETQLGINGGLESNNARSKTIIKLYGGNSYPDEMWIKSAKEIIGNQKFDQVWMEVVQSEYSEEFLEFISGLAPVRLAMMGESLLYTEEECRYAPVLRTRFGKVKKRLRYFTHVMCVDEDDVRLVETECGLPAFWWVVAVPEWSITRSIDEPTYDKASFSGPVYGARSAFLSHPELSRYMLHLSPLEKNTVYPKLFNRTQSLYTALLTRYPLLAEHFCRLYVSAILHIRMQMYNSWIKGLKRGIAVVQLPHFVKAFPSRIYEGMAAGRPVITMSLKNRPQAMKLFEPGKEILFYENDPEELVELIKMVQKDKNYAKQIAGNAARRMREFHTIDARVKHILHWIDTGDVPYYH